MKEVEGHHQPYNKWVKMGLSMHGLVEKYLEQKSDVMLLSL